MELLILFAIGWAASHAFSEKRDEYSASQEAHRQKYLAKLKNDHPSWSPARSGRYLQNAARRNALGHFAYLLRHGWSSTFNDFGEGWRKAKSAHEEWKEGHPKGGKKPGWLATLKAGWKDSMTRRPKATGYHEPRPELTPEPTPNPEPDPPKGKPSSDSSGQADEPAKTSPWLDENAAKDAQILPWPNTSTPGGNAGPTNGSTAVEYNFDGSKTTIRSIGQSVASYASTVEQIQADAIAGGLNADTQAMTLLSSLQEAIQNVMSLASAYVDNANKHQSGQEYANTGHAANTDYLRSS
jgi:hypothetical protein